MKILWICNMVLPKIAQALGEKPSFAGGWMTGLLEDMQKESDVAISICFNYSKQVEGEIDGIKYCSFNSKETLYNAVKKIQPDAVHIFGTEYVNAANAAEICKQLGIADKTVISIQGMVSIYAGHYLAGLPHYAQRRKTLRDFIKRSSIIKGKQVFEKTGEYEKKAIMSVEHVIGRTDWDYACTRQINPDVKYHFCNETLRGTFYENKWNLEQCEKHSIFVSQCNYPIKGFHHMIEAMPIILRFFPDAKLYTTGRSIIKEKGFFAGLKLTYYEVYLKKLIKKYNLEDKIEFLGGLDEKKMCERYMKSHVFASPSSIENSPNSVGEAMILGVPTVTSDVGGVKTLFNHNEDGFIYQADAPYMLADCIIKIFESDELAKMFSENARKHASITHNRENNLKTMIKIYEEIGKMEEKH